ncbi:MAG: RNA pseudouridine synthase [Oleiphilus sp.]|nr:MAG: RNA pseudouridine synthase [Oleiphilus sp.]
MTDTAITIPNSSKREQPFFELYGDESLLFIHKPAEIPFHSSDQGAGIVSLVRDFYCGEKLFPVHRLDKVTSGIMVFARSEDANRAVSYLFEQRQVEKSYLAVSDRKPQKKQGRMVGDMLKARGGSYKLARSRNSPAITRFVSRSAAPGAWLFLLHPKTGKTHQLRVAMKALGSPILGDARYGGAPHLRTCLHAFRIAFTYQGQRYEVEDLHLQDAYFSGLLETDEMRSWLSTYRS